MGTINTDERIKFSDRIPVRIALIILIILSTGIGSIIVYYLISRDSAIIISREKAIKEESEIIYIALKKNMLAGEAPTAVELFRDFAKSDTVGEVMLYRKDGTSAFSDNETLNSVNTNASSLFKPKTVFANKEKLDSKDFKTAVNTINNVFLEKFEGTEKKIIIYKPLINQPRCSKCHGLDHIIRGVIRISTPVNDVYEKMNKDISFSAIAFGIVILAVSLVIIVFLYKFVITRIYKISAVLQGVAEENYITKMDIDIPDEIGKLGGLINKMIDGLRERTEHVKAISGSIADHVEEAGEISTGGEKKTMTVLFSEIKGLTCFSEKRAPAEVMRFLNELINLQGDIIHEYGGDFDIFAGNKIMAIFDGKDMVINAIRAAEKIKTKIKEKYSDPDNSVHVGIGINTGEMISGNIGYGNRLKRTVICDPVNLGARLCSAAGKNTIILSEFSYGYVTGRVEAVKHNPIRAGKPIEIYTLRRTL